MLTARGLRRLAAAVCLSRRSASAVAALPGAGAARFHDYDAAITECVERRALREGRQVHARMVAAGYRPAPRLVIMYARCGALEDARNVLDGMPERNVVSWTAMISGYSQNERPEEAWELFIMMLRAGRSLKSFCLLLPHEPNRLLSSG
jgi:pentatricopeptide repeat protein